MMMNAVLYGISLAMGFFGGSIIVSAMGSQKLELPRYVPQRYLAETSQSPPRTVSRPRSRRRWALVPPGDRKLMVPHSLWYNIERDCSLFLGHAGIHHPVVPHVAEAEDAHTVRDKDDTKSGGGRVSERIEVSGTTPTVSRSREAGMLSVPWIPEDITGVLGGVVSSIPDNRFDINVVL